MREVEAELVGPHRRACLPHVLAEHVSQRLLQEVRAGVVRHRRETHGPRHARADAIARGEARPAEEKRLVALQAVGIHELSNVAGAVVELDRAGIRHLTPAGRIERRLAQLREEVVVVHDLERADLRDDVGLRVTDELGREVRGACEVGGALKLTRAAGARDVAMPLHLDAVAVDVDGLAPLLGELDRELERKPVRRGEREGLLARDRLVGTELLEELEPALERLEEPLLLEPKDASDLVGVLGELRVGIGHLLDHDAGETMDVVQPDPLRLLHRAADDPSQDVPASLVRRRHAVPDEERHPTPVVGEDPMRLRRRRGVAVRDDPTLPRSSP